MNRPRILVNAAMTVDGKLDSSLRGGAIISSPADKRRVDALRAAVDAVLVGGNTLRSETPKLTVRDASLRQERLLHGKPENPAKVGIASLLRSGDLPAECAFLTAGPARILLFTTQRTGARVIARLQATGAQVYVNPGQRVDLPSVFHTLYQLGMRTLLVEGGGTLIAELFRLGLVDELTLYVTPRLFGGATAPTLADGVGFTPETAPRLELQSVHQFDEDGGILLHYTVQTKE